MWRGNGDLIVEAFSPAVGSSRGYRGEAYISDAPGKAAVQREREQIRMARVNGEPLSNLAVLSPKINVASLGRPSSVSASAGGIGGAGWPGSCGVVVKSNPGKGSRFRRASAARAVRARS